MSISGRAVQVSNMRLHGYDLEGFSQGCESFQQLHRKGRGKLGLGSRVCRGEAILFFPEQLPATAERVLVEETQPVMTGLEGAACHASLAQAEQVAPHLFLTEQIG